MISNAKNALEAVLEEEEDELYVEYNPNPVVGNSQGLSLAALPREIIQLKNKFVEQDKLNTLFEGRVMFLEGKIHNLCLSLHLYEKIRHRFIDTHARDKLGLEVTPSIPKHIVEANSAAHGGDVKMDAELYRDGRGRTDIVVFKDLYGLVPHVIWTITHEETITLLNAHAVVKASMKRVGSEKFYRLFSEFIEAFENFGYNTTYLEANKPAPLVYKAFWNFMGCIKDEVHEVVVKRKD